MPLDRNNSKVRAHAGSYFIVLGTILLFLGGDGALSIANNYVFYLVAILVNLINVLINWEQDIRVSAPFLLTSILIAALDIIHISFGIYERGAMISIVFYLMLVLSVMLADFNFMDARVISNGVVLSSVIFTFLILFSGRELYPGSSKYTFVQWFGRHLVFEPNFLGAFLTLGFCLSVYSIFGPMRYVFGTGSRIFNYAGSGIILIGIILTGSRSAMLSVCIFGMMIFILMKPGTLKKQLMIIAAAGIVLLIIMLLIGVIPKTLFQRVFSISSYLDASNSKRIEDWIYGLRLILDKPVFGNGPALTEDLIMYHYNFSGEAHNTFINVGAMYGIPVLVLVCIHIAKLIRKTMNRGDIIMVSLMTAMLFEWNILPCQFTVSAWIAIIICMIVGNASTRWFTVYRL